MEAGLLRDDVDPALIYETPMDIFAANIRAWAASGFDIELVEYRMGFGQALILAALAKEPHASALLGRAMEFQRRIIGFERSRPAARVGAAKSGLLPAGADAGLTRHVGSRV